MVYFAFPTRFILIKKSAKGMYAQMTSSHHKSPEQRVTQESYPTANMLHAFNSKKIYSDFSNIRKYLATIRYISIGHVNNIPTIANFHLNIQKYSVKTIHAIIE